MTVVDFQQKRLEAGLKKCREQAGGATEIDYKGAKILAPNNHIEQALYELSRDEARRKRIMRNVNKYLAKNFNKVMAGKAAHKVAMNVSLDIAIWYANKLLEDNQEVSSDG